MHAVKMGSGISKGGCADSSYLRVDVLESGVLANYGASLPWNTMKALDVLILCLFVRRVPRRWNRKKEQEVILDQTYVQELASVNG